MHAQCLHFVCSFGKVRKIVQPQPAPIKLASLQKMKLSELKSADVAQLAIVEADEASTMVMAPVVADLAQLLFGFIENKQTEKT